MYSTGPLSTSLGRLDATPYICSAIVSAGDSMQLQCFFESVVALKVYSRGF